MTLRTTGRVVAALVAAIAIVGAPRVAGAQAPWKVTVVTPTTPVPIGACLAVQLLLKDASGKDSPRNPAGWRVGMEDFDLEVTSADSKSAAGQYHGPNNFSVCACQGATIGASGLVTATYPSKTIAPKSRVPNVAFKTSAPFTVGKAQGTHNPDECKELATPAVAVSPTAPPAGGGAPTTAPASEPLTVVTTMPLGTATPAGTGMTGGTPISGAVVPTTGTPVPLSGATPVDGGTLRTATAAAPTGLQVTGTPVSATLAWNPVAGVNSYSMRRQQAGVPDVQRTILATVRSIMDVGLLPSTAYTYTISANQPDGRSGSASVAFTTLPPRNPAGFTAAQVAQGAARLRWLPVPGVSYYVVLGPGSSNGGAKVVGDTQFIATAVPTGLQTWSVGSYYDPAPGSTTTGVGPNAVSTPAAQFPTAQANIAAPSTTVPVAPPGSTTAKQTNLDPGVFGFKFINTFSNSFIGPPVSMTTSGLCGGMSYAVLDYYNAKIPIGGQDYRPANGTTLHGYLYNRQVTSLTANIDKWVEYSVNPFGSRSAEFFNWGLNERLTELRSFIDRGVPVPLGMKSPNGGIGGDHQVIAIGYDMGRYQGALGEFKEDLKLFILDPNHPGKTVTLVPDVAALEYHYVEWPNEKWRSYFVDGRYSAMTPPNIPNPAYPNDGLAHELEITFTTGADDMRGGADHVDLVLRMADNSTQSYTNISLGGRWLPNYFETVQLVLTTPVAKSAIKSMQISTNSTGGLNGDNWDMKSVLARAVVNGVRTGSYTSSPDVPFRFTGAQIPFVVNLLP
ncbi:MAG: hypothetical protein ABIP93_04730 [Gemmatimonadaceae bacterium]